jgi:hypothetical protein
MRPGHPTALLTHLVVSARASLISLTCITRRCVQVGYGEAGLEIIAENMASGKGLDPMVPGKKVVAIFGFCDIRLFNDVTEVLQVELPTLHPYQRLHARKCGRSASFNVPLAVAPVPNPTVRFANKLISGVLRRRG